MLTENNNAKSLNSMLLLMHDGDREKHIHICLYIHKNLWKDKEANNSGYLFWRR